MCTAITYHTKDYYFGRNFDLEYSYHETVTITPRNYPFKFLKEKEIAHHYALIGMAYVNNNYPLYYDAINEKGVGMAGLNFPDNAFYHELSTTKNNIASFEFIPWVLSQCANLEEVRALLENLNIANLSFSKELPASPLHWIISYQDESLTVESVKDGLKIYDNPVGVLTNNPTFDYQMFNLNNYMNLSIEPPVNNFAPKINLEKYSRGMGALGLPGDLSSQSRFVKAVFTKMNSLSDDSEASSVSQFFHILTSVEQQRGCVHMGDNKFEITIYSACCNLDKGIYYYLTYDNHQITAIDMHKENLDSDKLINYNLITEQQIYKQN